MTTLAHLLASKSQHQVKGLTDTEIHDHLQATAGWTLIQKSKDCSRTFTR